MLLILWVHVDYIHIDFFRTDYIHIVLYVFFLIDYIHIYILLYYGISGLSTTIDEDDSLQWAFNYVNNHTDQDLALELFSIDSKISYHLDQQTR